MVISKDLQELNTNLSPHYCSGEKIGFVPTMGALHEGHASLIKRAVADTEVPVVSIFVNPTQFGPTEDLDKYPKPLETDLALCRSLGVKHVFCPPVDDMYPEGRDGNEIMLDLRSLNGILCAASRPGHMNGVIQVVSKLFNLVRPDKAYFGEKDFQQLTIIRRLAAELFFPVEVVGCPIIREADGLAMSSRNRYLNAGERKQALFLSHALHEVRANARTGMAAEHLNTIVKGLLPQYPGIRLDYFEIRRSADLAMVETLQPEDAPRAFIAAFCGPARLIDNMPVWD